MRYLMSKWADLWLVDANSIDLRPVGIGRSYWSLLAQAGSWLFRRRPSAAAVTKLSFFGLRAGSMQMSRGAEIPELRFQAGCPVCFHTA